MVSMLTPRAAASRASTPNACAVIGRPSTTMVCVDGTRMISMSSLRSMVTSSPTRWIAVCTASTKPVAVGHFRGAGHQHAERQPAADHHLLDVEQLDAWCRESTSNSADVTPG